MMYWIFTLIICVSRVVYAAKVQGNQFVLFPNDSVVKSSIHDKAFIKEFTSSADKAFLRKLRLEKSQVHWPLPMSHNILIAAKGLTPPSTPVWLMRQAGRYLPEFLDLRYQKGFLEICEDPILSAELTLQPLRRFPDIDAVIVFSDILTIPIAMGNTVYFNEDSSQGQKKSSGISFKESLETGSDVMNFLKAVPTDVNILNDRLGYVYDAIFTTRLGLLPEFGGKISMEKLFDYSKAVFNWKERISTAATIKPVIGFTGCPWTLFTYMIQGGSGAMSGVSEAKWLKAKKFIQDYPTESHALLSKLGDIIVEYVVQQLDSGAQMIQLFDTNAAILPPAEYWEFGGQYVLKIASQIKARRPTSIVLGFPLHRPLSQFIQQNLGLPANNSNGECIFPLDGMSIGWGDDPTEMRERFGWTRAQFKQVETSSGPVLKKTDKLSTEEFLNVLHNKNSSPLVNGWVPNRPDHRSDNNCAAVDSKSFALQGNLDPHKLYASDSVIRETTQKMVTEWTGPGYIANLGHGMEPGMSHSKVEAFVKAVKSVQVGSPDIVHSLHDIHVVV